VGRAADQLTGHTSSSMAYTCTEDRFRKHVFTNSLTISKLLSHESSIGKHVKAAVLKLPGLHGFKFRRVFGFEHEGVKAKVSGDVLRAEKTGPTDWDIIGFNKANFSALGLELTNGSCKDNPERKGDMGEVSYGGSLDGCIEKEERPLNLLANEETNDCKHGHTAVRELGLAVSLQGASVGLGSEAKRVKHTHWSRIVSTVKACRNH
jgi:hypothetical protein